MRESKLTIVVVAGVCLVLLVMLVTYSVPVHKTAVVYRWNRPRRVIRPPVTVAGQLSDEELAAFLPDDVEVVTEAGWFFKWPYPIDRVSPVEQWVRTLEAPLVQIQLPDDNQILPRMHATWRIVDPLAFERTLQGDDAVAARRLRNIISDQTASVFGNHVLADVVNTDPERLKFDEIEQKILDGVRRVLREQNYGIAVASLGTSWIALPESTTEAVFARMREERNASAESLLADGEREKRTIIAAARETAERRMARAEAEARTIRAEAEALAATYYDTFAEDETLAIFLRRLDAIRRIASDAAANDRPVTFVVSTQTEPFTLFEAGIDGAPDVDRLLDDMATLGDGSPEQHPASSAGVED